MSDEASPRVFVQMFAVNADGWHFETDEDARRHDDALEKAIELRDAAARLSLAEARGLLWRLRRYEALDDSPATEDAGVALSEAFDEWYASNPDPLAAPPAATPPPCASWCSGSVQSVPTGAACYVRGGLAFCAPACHDAGAPRNPDKPCETCGSANGLIDNQGMRRPCPTCTHGAKP